MTTRTKSPVKSVKKLLLPGKEQMPADLSFFAWIWLVIPAAIGSLLVWVLILELQHVFRLFRVFMKGLLK